MIYSIEQLSNQRWGIYVGSKLLATIGCRDKCLAVLKMLQDKKRLGVGKYKFSA